MTHSRHTLILLTTVTAVLAAGSVATAQTPLAYKFKAGDVLAYDLVVAQKGTTRADDKEFTGLQQQVVSMTWQVQSVDDKGTARVSLKFDRVRLSSESPKESLEVTSDAKAEPDKEAAKAMYTTAKAMAKIQATFAMTPQGEVDKVSIPASALKEIKAIPGAEQIALGWTDENLQTTLRDAVLSLPAEGVAKGKAWKRKVEGVSPYGKISGDLEFAYDGKAERDGRTLEKFQVRPKLKIEPDPKSGITIKNYDSDGWAYFDGTLGQMVEVTTVQRIEAQAEVMGKTITQKTEVTNSLKRTKR